jgi:hypothetical protein
MGGGSGDVNNDPWKKLQPFLLDIFGGAKDLYEEGPRPFYPGSTVGPRSAMTLEGEQAGLDLIRGAGTGPVNDYLSSVMSESFLDNDDPYLDSTIDAAMGDVSRHFMTSVSPNLTMGGLGRGGSGAEANVQGQAYETLADSLGDLSGGMRLEDRSRRQGLQSAAAGMYPGIQAANRADVTTGYGLGQGADAYDQNILNDMIARFEWDRDEPWKLLQMFREAINPGELSGYGTQSGGQGTSGTQIAGTAIGGIGALASVISALGPAAAVAPVVASSRALKDRVDEVDYDAILHEVEQLPIEIWKYKDEVETDTHEPHIGPYAEDFRRHFGVGNDHQIFLMDGIGIALASIKALTARVKHLESQLDERPDAEVMTLREV